MIIDKSYMKYFLLLILYFFCTINSLAQGQIVRRKIIAGPKLVVPEKNEVARKKVKVKRCIELIPMFVVIIEAFVIKWLWIMECGLIL